mmetsp:Transcript_16551/g.32305  ORF Transcript_16551/g.32305 Transcript_16551/m.32305 type:complete len:100 (+) Transcript_16551:870-1169(+)
MTILRRKALLVTEKSENVYSRCLFPVRGEIKLFPKARHPKAHYKYQIGTFTFHAERIPRKCGQHDNTLVATKFLLSIPWIHFTTARKKIFASQLFGDTL